MAHVSLVFQLPLAVPFWVVFFFAFVLESKVVRPALGDKASTQDEGAFCAIMIGSPLALLAAITTSYVPWLTIALPDVSVVIGTLLLMAGAILRRRCFNALGASFTGKVIVEEGQQIIQTGVYRYVRYPSYTVAFMMFFGVGLVDLGYPPRGIPKSCGTLVLRNARVRDDRVNNRVVPVGNALHAA
jgi:protein-S-isoprenylcysteine O-methyltransferase Ste14